MKNTANKKVRKITMRELLRNSKEFRSALEAGVSFELYLRDKKIAKINPVANKKSGKKYTKEDFFKNFIGKAKNIKGSISNDDIDRIVYDY